MENIFLEGRSHFSNTVLNDLNNTYEGVAELLTQKETNIIRMIKSKFTLKAYHTFFNAFLCFLIPPSICFNLLLDKRQAPLPHHYHSVRKQHIAPSFQPPLL